MAAGQIGEPAAMCPRLYRPADAPALAALIRAAVAGIAPRDYDARQIAAWLARVPDAEALAARLGDGRRVWVAVDDRDRPRGFIDLIAAGPGPDNVRVGHIDLFHVAPEARGRGVAAALFDRLQAAARAEGLGRLTVMASRAARRFFLRRGFTVVTRRDLALSGTAIDNFACEKWLSLPVNPISAP